MIHKVKEGVKIDGMCGVGFVAFLWFYPLVRGVDKQIFLVVVILKERGGERVLDNILAVRGIEAGV